MKKIVFVFLLASHSITISAQTDTIKIQKPVNVWIYTKESDIQRGVLTGGFANGLLIYPGSMKDYLKQVRLQPVSISYENIGKIKTKRRGGILKGIGLGGAIGFAPVIAGEGGAYVALMAVPLGVVTGAIVGATSKKKYVINGDAQAFRKFTAKFIK